MAKSIKAYILSWATWNYKDWDIFILVEYVVWDIANNQDWTPETEEYVITRARGYIMHLISAFLILSIHMNNVNLGYLPFLEDLHLTS